MKIIVIVFSIILVIITATQLFAYKSQKDIETYPYTVKKKYDGFEIRNYKAALFTSIKLSKNDYKETSSKGFSILAGYIFGKNDRNEKIAMTSPVSMSLEDSTTMMFMVPSKFEKEDLPKPNQSSIQFKNEPEKTVAAIRFSGWANDEKIEKYKQELIALLEKEGISYSNRFYFLGYNAPYELFNRRNEIIVELD